jgi:two-component system sensor histidine kinase VanS
MKNILKAGLIISGAILLCLGLVWLADSGFNGVFKEWFYSYFDVGVLASGKGKIGVIFSNWYYIKQFFVIVFFSLLAILVLCAFISANLYSRYRSKRDMEFISRTIGSMADSETETVDLPQKYSEIEKQLTKVNNISQKRQQLAQSEMQRKNDLITYLAHDLKTPLICDRILEPFGRSERYALRTEAEIRRCSFEKSLQA